MPINNIPSNAPANMQPWVRVLEAQLAEALAAIARLQRNS